MHELWHVAWSVYVCWAYGWAVQQWLNCSKCHLGADSCEPKEPWIRWGPDPPREGALFRGTYRPIVTYLGMANVPAHRMQPTHRCSAFAGGRGDMTTMWSLSKFWHLSHYSIEQLPPTCLVEYCFHFTRVFSRTTQKLRVDVHETLWIGRLWTVYESYFWKWSGTHSGYFYRISR